MKKLMIAAAIVCAAAMSQAAKVDWSLSSKNTIKHQNGSDGISITCYLINTKATDYATLTADLASGTATAANISSYAAYLDEATTGDSGAKIGKITGAVAEKNSIIAGGDVYARFVAFDSNTSGNWYYLSGEAHGVGYDGSEEFPTGSPASWNTYVADNWHEVSSGPSPVPEPTSGLLLLLGVAGLALKRKRA